MSKIKDLGEIDEIVVHWSESALINSELGCDDNCDIEKKVCPFELDDLINRASKLVPPGYDKTNMSITLKNGLKWASEIKFYLTKAEPSLLLLLNKGQ